MSDSNSNSAPPGGKPQRPEGETTLFWHASGRWCKKIRGSLKYFGRGTYQEAFDLYTQQKDALHAGRRPRDDEPEGLTVYLLCAKFLKTKLVKVKAGKLAQRTLDDYAATCKLIIKAFGKNRLASDIAADDFEKLAVRMSRTWGPVRVGNEINRVRIVFRYAHDQLGLPRMVFGEAFRRPSKKELRKHKREKGAKHFTAAEVRKMIDGSEQPLRSMILLGINCAFGNSDIGTLPLSAIDLAGGWANYHRPKTEIDRRIPLWPETVASLREWLEVRPVPKRSEHAGLMFITKYGGPWDLGNRSLTNETRKLLDRLAISGNRNFYCLRHTLQTIGEEERDFIAVRRIMGHASGDISEEYREFVSDDRLRKVTEFVRAWLFAG